MDLRFSPEEEAFRDEARAFLTTELSGEYADIRGRGAPGDEHAMFDRRHAWERRLGEARFTCLGWPKEVGGRGASLHQQVIWYEEYARAGGPGRVGHIGEGLLGPTILALGTDAQKQRFLPKIVSGDELWCQGYSEPNAGSDLANVQTRAELVGDEWVITGQKIWTSLAHQSDWCFVIARTDPGSKRHEGLSYLLVPMRQPGIEVRPIVQITGTSEFNEVFFDGARTAKDCVVGGIGNGWKVAMATLGFERGASTLGQQLSFENEIVEITRAAKENGKSRDAEIRRRIAHAWMGLRLMRLHALRTLSGPPGREATISKVYWATWHRDLGELAMDVLGHQGELIASEPYELTAMQRLFLFSRSDTIYAGSNEIQKNIIGERALGLPREPRLALMETETRSTVLEMAPSAPPYPAGRNLLAGRTVVVTAAAGTGIGFSVALRCAEEGARVLISDVHERRLGEAADKLAEKTGVRPPTALCNVTLQEDVDRLFATAVKELGHVDVLMNNAGLGGTANVVDMTDDQWAKVMDVSLTGTFRMTRAALAHMIPRKTGAIVNNASVLGWRAQAGQAHYAAAKAGVMALTRCSAIEAAPHGIRINAVAPSIAMHAFLAKVTTKDLLDELSSREAFGRAAEPWEVASVMAFLASDYASYMTGEVLAVSSQHALEPNARGQARPGIVMSAPESASSCTKVQTLARRRVTAASANAARIR